MADNVSITAGSGTTIAADDIGGVLHQRVKLSQGADGAATDVSAAAPLNVTLANTGANATPVVVDLGANNDVTITGTVAVTDNSGSLTVDNSTLSVVGGGTEATAMRVTLASDSTGVLSVDDNGGSLTVDGTVAATQSGTWDITNVSGTVSLPTGAATAAKQPALGTAGTPSADVITVQGVTSMTPLKVDGSGVTQPVSGTVTASNTAGDVAHDSADSGNPVKIGGKAVSSEPTAVANADRANLITDLVGKLITLPYANPENFVSGAITTAMTGTTSTSLVAAPGSGLRNYITTIIVSNAHATVGTDIVIQDGSGGTTLLTIPAAAVYGGAVINLPVPLRQPTTNTAIYCANVTTGASTKVSAVGYKGA